ncbi:MAG: DUF507 family protein [Myxococcota bacterium]
MKLYSGKIPTIAEEIVNKLVGEGSIETESREEVRLDLEAVLKEYLRRDRAVVEEAKNRMEHRKLGYSHLGRTKAEVAKDMGAPTQDDILPYLIGQVLNMLFHSNNVEEIYAEDRQLRMALTPIFKRHMDLDDELDREVRSKIKNLQEGTATFEIEYGRVMEQIRRKRGLTERN